jgi:hypothetical protein
MSVYDGSPEDQGGSLTVHPSGEMSDEAICNMFARAMVAKGAAMERHGPIPNGSVELYAQLNSRQQRHRFRVSAGVKNSGKATMSVTLASTPYTICTTPDGDYYWAAVSTACEPIRDIPSGLFETREAACATLAMVMTARFRELDAAVDGLTHEGLSPFGAPPRPAASSGRASFRSAPPSSAFVNIMTTSPADSPIVKSVTPFGANVSDVDFVRTVMSAVRTHLDQFCIAPDERTSLLVVTVAAGDIPDLRPSELTRPGGATTVLMSSRASGQMFICIDDQGRYDLAEKGRRDDGAETFSKCGHHDSREEAIAHLGKRIWQMLNGLELERDRAAARRREDAIVRACFPQRRSR